MIDSKTLLISFACACESQQSTEYQPNQEATNDSENVDAEPVARCDFVFQDLYFFNYENWIDADKGAASNISQNLFYSDFETQYVLLDSAELPMVDFASPDGRLIASGLNWHNIRTTGLEEEMLDDHPEEPGDYILMGRVLMLRNYEWIEPEPGDPIDFLLCESRTDPPIIPDRPTPETGDPPPEDTAPWAPPPQPEPTFPNFDKRYQKWIRVGPDPAETDAPPPAGLPSPTWVPSRASHCHP